MTTTVSGLGRGGLGVRVRVREVSRRSDSGDAHLLTARKLARLRRRDRVATPCGGDFDAAADKIGIERCTPNRDMRRSYASMLAARGYGVEMIRFCLGHLGPPTFDESGKYQRAGKSSVATQHYLRGTEDLIRMELRRRRKSL